MPDADAPSTAAPSTAADIALMTEAAEAAADIALGYFRQAPKVWQKANASPVSEADLAVDRYLRERLQAARPDYGWLSEETEDNDDRLARRRLFVVDPIDGTRGFLAGSDQWTISLAVVDDGQPVAAVLFQPTLGRLYLAEAGGGARLDGRRLMLPSPSEFAGVRVAGPSAMVGRLKAADRSVTPSGYVASLALRIAMVADGSIDVALARPGAHDWDIAAADLILAEAGARLVDTAGERLIYNRLCPVHGALIGAGVALSRRLAGLLGPS